MTTTVGRTTGAETRLPGESSILPLAARENFTVASLLVGRRTRAHLTAIYGFARLVDQLGDEVDGDRSAILDAFDVLLEFVQQRETVAVDLVADLVDEPRVAVDRGQVRACRASDEQ